MDKIEELMLKVMAELTLSEAPITFKGAMMLKIALSEQSETMVTRATRDIDGDWLTADIDMDKMQTILSNAIRKVDPTLSISPFREFSAQKSAGFKIFDEHQERIFGIDLRVHANPHAKKYPLNYQGSTVFIQGVFLSQMLADKLCAMSSHKIFRRAKDLIDVYLLSYAAQFNFIDILQTIQHSGRKLENFNGFCQQKAELQHAYEKLDRVKNKPDFMVLYNRLQTFLAPFLEQKLTSLEWAGERWEVPQKTQENRMIR